MAASLRPSPPTTRLLQKEPTMADQNPVADLSYEAARDELVETVQRLEAGGTSLEESLALWERGEALAQRCQEWLDGARTRLDEVVAARKAD
jgi:exodeoxyribonuclease VII small subunit